MSSKRPSLRAVFNEASEIVDPAQRAAFLDSACQGDAALRTRVERLLQADSQAGNFMRASQDPRLDPRTEKIGDRIGRYRLLEQLGRGGCGVVYLAEQEEPVRRRVALKVIRLGMDTADVISRFEAERQSLAMMDHPNIARVLDAGATETGRPFFVMELVAGIPITHYCDQKGLSIPERLELFILVCQAVQHAHQKGIIHRDLKPGNILVTEQDGRPIPKVIDFGVAKATAQNQEHPDLTRADQFVGTPAFMSPEQVEFGAHDIDTRTDIYSLGIVLYELMTGQCPFDSKELVELGLDRMRHVIREVDPPRPSALIAKGAKTTRLVSTSSITRERFVAVRGDIDWIVMKCLEKERARRYQTAHDLALDLRRHLDNEPIAARPQTGFYRFQKVVRRNRIVFLTAGVIAMVLVAAVVVSSWQAYRATVAERLESKSRGLAEIKARESQQRLIHRYISEGNRLTEEGLPVLALSWMVEGLRLESGDSRSEADERLRIAQAQVGAPELKLHLAQGRWVHSVALSPDGSRLASGGNDGVIRITEVLSGANVGTNLSLPDVARRVRFSRDGRRLVGIDQGGRARIWNAENGQAITPLLQADDFDERSLGSLAERLRPEASFSPDGTLLLVAWGSKSAQLRDATDGHLLRQFTHRDVVCHAAFSPDGQWVVTSGKDGVAQVWEVATGKPAGPPLKHDGVVIWSQFSSDGNKLMTVRDRHFVQLWDWRAAHPIAPEIPRRSVLFHASLSPDNSKIFTVARSGYAHLYDAATSRLLNQFQHQGGLVDASFSPDGRQVAIACHDGNVWVWDVDDYLRRPMVLPEGNQIEQIAFSGKGRHLAVATRGGHARVWELAPPERGVRRLPGKDVQWVEFDRSGNRALIVNTGGSPGVSVYDAHTAQLISTANAAPLTGNQITCARFSPNGRRILAFGKARGVIVLDADSGRRLLQPVTHEDRLQEALWSPDGKFIFSAPRSGATRMWDCETGKTIRSFAPQNSVRAMALSPDGTRLATGHEDGTVQIWDSLTAQRLPPRIKASGAIGRILFSPDGRRIAISTSPSAGEGMVEVRDVGSGELVGRPLGHRDEVGTFEFSGDGRWLATACDDHRARVWDAATGEPVSPWLPHDHETLQVSFSPDGGRLATLARRGAARLWSLPSGVPITAPIVYPRNEGNGWVSYSPDGGKLLLARGGNEAFLRDLQPEAAGLEELTLLAQVNSCMRFDAAAGLVPLDEETLNSAWKQLQALRRRR